MAVSSKTKNVSRKSAHAFKEKGAKKASEKLAKTNPMDFIISDLRYYIDQQTKVIYTDKDPNEKPSNRSVELHPSSYPYCGLRQIYRDLKGIKAEPMDFYGEYYTSLGTLKHELMQKYLGRGKKILGDWKCLDCDYRMKLTTYKKCPKCQSVRLLYEEIGIKFGKWTHGHIDGVVQINGKWYVIDYKTTSTKKNAEHRKTGKVYPYGYNVAQISSYCFDLDTFVVTDKGKVRIRNIIQAPLGTYKVLSYNHSTEKSEYKDVTFTSEHPTEECLMEIEYDGGKFRVTESHEVWSVTRNAYIKAKDLLEGEDLLLLKPD